MKRFHIRLIFFYTFVFSTLIGITCCTSDNQKETPDGGMVPVIYISDLFHPHGDMDDQVDLATIFTLDRIDVKAVILENTEAQQRRPGEIPLQQISFLSGKNTPFATGLSHRLRSLHDTGGNQPHDSQQGVELILKVLEESQGKVTIVTVGSLRDVAAAYNREPELFNTHVERIFVFAGEASKAGFLETNVKLDKNGFLRVMRSTLPVVWIPCFDGGLWRNNGHASYWQTTYGALLKEASAKLQQYFLYAYQKNASEPIEYLQQPVDPVLQRKLFKKARNLWSCAVFPALQDERVVLEKGVFRMVPAENADPKKLLYSFRKVNVYFSDSGDAVYDSDHPETREILQFEIVSRRNFGEVMTAVAASYLARL